MLLAAGDLLAQPSVYLLLRHPFQQPSRPLTPGQLNGSLAPKLRL